ncbi:uncharacterized protein LOC117217483 [Megalopta genalis]|uniref:uncharacterized protein LOC117217483 n=1 Tax=Megalopta genalis TaxID=115081 RepID=UPI003FCF270A
MGLSSDGVKLYGGRAVRELATKCCKQETNLQELVRTTISLAVTSSEIKPPIFFCIMRIPLDPPNPLAEKFTIPSGKLDAWVYAQRPPLATIQRVFLTRLTRKRRRARFDLPTPRISLADRRIGSISKRKCTQSSKRIDIPLLVR